MKKILTFAVAVLASMAMMAQVTLFSATPLQTLSGKQTVSEAGEVQVTAEQATIAGGTFSLITDRSIDFIQKQSNNYAFAITATATGYKIVLEHAIAEGDIVSVTALTNGSGESNGRGIFVTTANARQSTANCTLLSVSTTAKAYVEVSHTVAATDDLVGATTIYIWRATGNNTYFKDFAITRPETRQIVSQTESLFNAKVNGEAMLIDDFTDLLTSHDLQMDAEYVTAPVVTFVKQISTTYDDQSSDVTYEDIDVTAEVDAEFQQLWAASATINNIVYRVRMHIAASHTVTYMYGEQVLGTETVAIDAHPQEYAQYETMALADFGGWYRDSELEEVVADMGAESINADVTYYADFTLTYLASSVNIEQLVLDNGKSYNIESALTAAGWEYANIDALDSLNDDKTARNEPYLGLKLKTAGAYVRCRLQVGDDRLYIKFGNVGCDVKIALKGATVNIEETLTKDALAQDNNIVGVFGQPEDVLVTITTTAASTVVLKQLMLGAIEEVVLPTATAIDNAAVTQQATKRIVNGQVIILRDGKTYNALGTEVR